MCRARETVSATMNAAAVAVDRVVKANVRAVVVGNYSPGLSFFKDFELRFRRFTEPFNRMRQPGIGRIFDGMHDCKLVLSMQQAYQIRYYLASATRMQEFQPRRLIRSRQRIGRSGSR